MRLPIKVTLPLPALITQLPTVALMSQPVVLLT